MEMLKNKFDQRDELINYVKELCPWADGQASHIQGGLAAAKQRLEQIDPIKYAKSRNFGDGAVTMLSPYIRHGILSLNEVRHEALKKCSQPEQIKVFLQELAWRDYWQYLYARHPDWIWNDVEEYKTGFSREDYADSLPVDIQTATTNVSCINAFITQLIETGYLHNHARMYLAAYVVHFRRIKWQVGARWFLRHLLDADPASNNLSWQWVASTFSHKPYIFNLENVHHYFGKQVDTTPANNAEIAKTYEELNDILFPHVNR